MGDDLIFEEPPRPGHGKVTLWLEQVRDNPGRWVKYPKRTSPSTAANIKKGVYAGVLPDEFEVARRNVSGSPVRCDMYVRYIGGQS